MGGRCQPKSTPECSTLGAGWEDVGIYYHSHPSSSSFSGGDRAFVDSDDSVNALWVTRGGALWSTVTERYPSQ